MLPKTIVTVQPQRASLPHEDTDLLRRYLAHPGERGAILDTLHSRISRLFVQAGNARTLGGRGLADRMSERASTLKAVLWKVRELSQADVAALME